MIFSYYVGTLGRKENEKSEKPTNSVFLQIRTVTVTAGGAMVIYTKNVSSIRYNLNLIIFLP